MTVLSNNGRLITSLPVSNQASDGDELLIQSGGVTKRIKYSTLKTNFLTGFNPYTSVVDFTALTNKFTGSLKGTSTGVKITLTTNDGIQGGGELTSNRTLSVDNTVVRTSGNQTIGGTKTFSSTIDGNLSGNVTSTGTSTFTTADINGGSIDSTIIGASSAAAVTGTTITANTGFVGDLTGDVYNSTSTKVLESGNTTPTINGGVASAFFYGTSSYATQALTAAYAAGGVGNGLPAGGSTYQVLTKTSNSDYQVTWTNPITASTVGSTDYLTIWDGARTLKNLNNFYWDGVNTYVIQTQLQVDQGIQSTGGFTGSFLGNSATVTVTEASPYKKINGHKKTSVKLNLSASGYCTMSLMAGQTTTVFVQNSGNFKVLKWSGSLDGGSTANTKIYWKNGLSASITQGDLKKDVVTFVNIDNKIFGTVINNFE